MGYDITFHSIKPDDITHFLFDVINRPELASKRIHELSKESAIQDYLKRLNMI
jgi:hypothetical protein